MKNIILSILIILAFPANSAFAISEINIEGDYLEKDVKELNLRFESIARKIGISKKEYLYAARQYMLIYTEESIHNFPKIQDRELYQSLIGHEFDIEYQSSYVRLNNEIKSDLASFLGIDVAKIDQFTQVIHALSFSGQFEDIDLSSYNTGGSTKATSGEMERIEVQCDDACQRPVSGMALNLYIYNRVSAQGIPQNNINNPGHKFVVKFVSNSTGQIVKSEIWTYNNFSGAYKVSNAPCGSCHTDI